MSTCPMPGFLFYRSHGVELCAQIDSIFRVDSFQPETGDLQAVIAFTDGSAIRTDEKPFAITERIRSCLKVPNPAPPEAPGSESFMANTGHEIEIFRNRHGTSGAWLILKGQSRSAMDCSPFGKPSLSVVADGGPKTPQTYIQYRDNRSRDYPRFALTVNSAGYAEIQVIVPGQTDSREMERLRHLSLDRVIALIEKETREHPEPA
jgi:hypothetical protein